MISGGRIISRSSIQTHTQIVILSFMIALSSSLQAEPLQRLTCKRPSQTEWFQLHYDSQTKTYTAELKAIRQHFEGRAGSSFIRRYPDLKPLYNRDYSSQLQSFSYRESFLVEHQTYPTGVVQGFDVRLSYNYGNPQWSISVDDPYKHYSYIKRNFALSECTSQ